MSSETRTSIRASERRRQRVVVAGVAGVAVLTAGAIAYWPGGSHDGAGSASSLALPANDSSGAPTDQAWDPTSASTTPRAGLLLGDDPNSGTSRGMVRTPLSPNAAPSGVASSSAASSAAGSSPRTPSSSAPSTTANQSSGQAQSGTPAPAAVPTAVPVLPSTSQPRPLIGHGTALAPETATSTATPTPPSTTTSSGTPSPTGSLPLSPTVSASLGATATATPTPTATRTRQGCVLFVVC